MTDTPRRQVFYLPEKVVRALQKEAAARGMTGECVASRILTTVVEDDLFAAVLDDDD